MNSTSISSSKLNSTKQTTLKNKKNTTTLHYRLHVLLRFIAAIIGGYASSALFATVLSLLLPLNKIDSVLLCTTISILIYACVFIWVFAVKSLRTVWISILLTICFQLAMIAIIKG